VHHQGRLSPCREFVPRLEIDLTIARREQTQAAPKSPPPIPPTESELTQHRNYLVDGLADIRKLLQRTGTALGAAATALLAGLGYARLHDVFPLPAGKWWISPVAVFLGALAVSGSVWLAYRFFAAQRRILISPSPAENINDIDKDERRLIATTYRRYVKRYLPVSNTNPDADDLSQIRSLATEIQKKNKNLAKSLYAFAEVASYDGDLLQVQNLADSLRDQGEEDLAERLARVVEIAQFDAVTKVLEHRSIQAFKGLKTGLALAMAVVGIFGLFAIADYSKSKRPGPNPAIEITNLDRTRAGTASIKANTALLCLKLRQAGVKPPVHACGP
jgi:hypothetical protein